MAPVSDDDVEIVKAATGLTDADNWIIRNALQSGISANDVVDEFWTKGMEEFLDRYKNVSTYPYQEDQFHASREGEPPSYSVHAEGDTPGVLYGQVPGYGSPTAPSRPPSRVHNRSPMDGSAGLIAGSFANVGPSNKDEEEEQYRRAVNLSLSEGNHTPGNMADPQTLASASHVPQQSGVTDANRHFGPANRPEYSHDEWAMVPTKRPDDDPAPLARARSQDTPAFLRNRDPTWKPSRLGGIIMVLHAIPMARNALLRTGHPPDYGYGGNPNWWKGEAILPPRDAQPEDAWATEVYPPLSDELHRLMAFLDSTERAYGTTDILGDIKTMALGSGDRERGFFEQLEEDPACAPFKAMVEISPNRDFSQYPATSSFLLLDSQASEKQLDQIGDSSFVNGLLNIIFNEDAVARITEAPEVLVLRSTSECQWPANTKFEESLDLSTHLAVNSEAAAEAARQQNVVKMALNKIKEKELELTTRINDAARKKADCRKVGPQVIKRCRNRIERIKQHARWRDPRYSDPTGEGTVDLYLTGLEGAEDLPAREPDLTPDEATMVSNYEATIKNWEAHLAKVDRVMKNVILPQRAMCEKLTRRIRTELDNACRLRWEKSMGTNNFRYSLRGVVSDVNTVFLRKRETWLMETDENQSPHEQWWKVVCLPTEGNVILAEMTTFQTVVEIGCFGCNPILIFATERAMDEAPLPLSDALKAFVTMDNRLFKKEISKQEENIPDTLDGAALTRSALRAMEKPRERAGSMDSMATNQASNDDMDVEMPDAERGDLVDVSNSPVQEMQERGASPLITRPATDKEGPWMGFREGP